VIVGLLHPGEMGSFVGSAVLAAGHEVLWASAGRSEASRRRAAAFTDAGTVEDLASRSDAIVSLCPPDRAVSVAEAVAAAFRGLYVEANAVSPATVGHIDGLLHDTHVVDGAVIGGPATDDAVLYLAGRAAGEAVELFDPRVLRVVRLTGPGGSASALKACYAASSKAVSALLLATRAAARAAGVEDALLAEWDRTQPGVRERTDGVIGRVHRTAWRFAGEMTEASDFFDTYDAPAGFSRAAAETYARLADLKGRPDDVTPAEVMDRVAPPQSA
jgi:3-hydroxyisobutyrate dehydrogenase-like beta-hydroxyacid dehydrogenase